MRDASRGLLVNDGEESTGGVGRVPATRERADTELLGRVAAGDEGALAELFRRHAHVVLSQVLLVVGEQALAEEILQDTMLAVWHQAGTFRGESRVRSWMIAIARRQARDRLRGSQLRVVQDTALVSQASTDAGPELIALERADVAEVASAIQTLGRAHREVLGLVFAAELSMAEVAEILEIPLGTVKSRLAAARGALGRALERGRKEGHNQ